VDRAQVDRVPAMDEFALGQGVALEHDIHGLQIEFRRQIADGAVFVIERLGRLGASPSPCTRCLNSE
jgi:hypothetical protein